MMNFEVIRRKFDGKYAIRMLKRKILFKPVYEWFQKNHEYKAAHYFDNVREAVVIEPNDPECAIWMDDKEALVKRFDNYYQQVKYIHQKRQVELTRKSFFDIEHACNASKEKYIVDSEMTYLY